MKVNQVKEKVAAKVAKGKAKVAAKCGKAAKCAALVFCLASLVLVGCQNPAQRAQTADCQIVIHGGTVTFGDEFQSLAQSNETAGNDAGQTASPTTDVRPDIDVTVPVNKANAGTSSAAGGALENVLSAGADWAAEKIRGSDDEKTTDAGPVATPSTGATAPDGTN